MGGKLDVAPEHAPHTARDDAHGRRWIHWLHDGRDGRQCRLQRVGKRLELLVQSPGADRHHPMLCTGRRNQRCDLVWQGGVCLHVCDDHDVGPAMVQHVPHGVQPAILSEDHIGALLVVRWRVDERHAERGCEAARRGPWVQGRPQAPLHGGRGLPLEERAQVALDHLARPVIVGLMIVHVRRLKGIPGLWQRIDDSHPRRNLERSQARAAPCTQLLHIHGPAGHHRSPHNLAQYRVGHSENGSLGHCRVRHEHPFDLAAVDVFASHEHHVLDAVHHPDAAV